MSRFAIAMIALTFASAGCRLACERCSVEASTTAYVLVEYESAAVVASTAAPEVSEAAAFRQLMPTVKTIGLQFPDAKCETETAARAEGKSSNSGANTPDAIMVTGCGVWLAELERALTDYGYKVISWGAIQQEQRTKAISTYQAAKGLGAEIVLVINSLETHDLVRDASAGRRTAYFRSDDMGIKADRLAMSQQEREPLKRFVIAQSGTAKADKIAGWAGTLDVTAVRASSGESIWFFRHSITRPRFSQTGMRFLFRKSTPTSPYVAVRPKGLPEVVAVEDRSAEDVEQVTVTGGPGDPFKAEKHALAKSVARECVERFSKGRK